MKKLTIACFLLGIAMTSREVKNLTLEEQLAVLQLVEKEYGIDVSSTPENKLMNVTRKMDNTRYWNHVYEGGRS